MPDQRMRELAMGGPRRDAPSEASPVIALTVLDTNREEGLLVVLRDPVSNPTHPNTLSVPTQRVPAKLFGAIKATGSIRSASPEEWTYEVRAVSNADATGYDPVIYAVEALFARKLGLADALESEAMSFRASLASVTLGHAEYGMGITETIEMANVVALITRGADLFPRQTVSYSRIEWAAPSRLVEAFETKDPLAVSSTLDPVEVCIHGLCVSSTVQLVASHQSRSRLIEALGT